MNSCFEKFSDCFQRLPPQCSPSTLALRVPEPLLIFLERLAGKAAVAAAANAAFEADLDLVVALGWTHVDLVSFQGFLEDVERAPPAARAVLRQLATLYGLSRVEHGLAFHLEHGALAGPAAAAVRSQVRKMHQFLLSAF